ncbi:MAG TPA: cytochrome c biogenesis protein CcsA [Phycisphaerae bacterium]|nr:cytochrome c biogenesis protein CcsA [Phycisphaerae bacterium]HNU46194.1 cytochrome c biogenesis protein CcsA [Phycisphaerae bacterium]
MTDITHSLLRTLGSLWLAAVILVLLSIAMACATVHEAAHDTEHALAAFYKSNWFVSLLGLLGVNLLASILVRYPFSRPQFGFLVTHVGILVTLGGALVTERWGTNGRIGFLESETVTAFADADRSTVVVTNLKTKAVTEWPLEGWAFQAVEAVDRPRTVPLTIEGTRLAVERYLPDARVTEEVVDDNPLPAPALEVSLSGNGTDGPVWLPAGQDVRLGSLVASFRVVDRTELETLLALPGDAAASESAGSEILVRVEVEGTTREFPLPAVLEQAQPIAETGYTIKVLRYLPHAQVGAQGGLTNVSDRPENPAIEAEVTGPDGPQRKLAFARFPDFGEMHGGSDAGPRVTLVMQTPVGAGQDAAGAPLQVLGTADGELYARFWAEGKVSVHPIVLGTPLESPWHGLKFNVLRRFEHARQRQVVEPVEPVRDTRMPALLVRVDDVAGAREVWLSKYAAATIDLDGVPHQLRYGDREVALGYELKLDRFHLGVYPGGRRPRSFESHVTITDPATGQALSRMISMNNPLKYGGYVLFQSSYREGQRGGRSASFLSVARDPGQPITFTGYIATLAGMLWVLVTRMASHRRRLQAVAGEAMPAPGAFVNVEVPAHAPGHPSPRVPVVLLLLSLGCVAAVHADEAKLPALLDLTTVRALPVQHDGRWMPLDTVARDLVRSVTGTSDFRGQDPVLALLAWTFDPITWMDEPLIPIGNPELRAELELPAEQSVFSYSDLVNHDRFRQLVDEAMHVQGRKPDPLESKVSGIYEKLLLLDEAFGGQSIRLLPHPTDRLAAWRPIELPMRADATPRDTLHEAWKHLRTAFLVDDGPAFTAVAQKLATELAALPAAYRPPPQRLALELRYNGLRPFHRASQIMIIGAALGALAMWVRRRWFDALAVLGLLAGFFMLSYGLYLRWQIAGRIPATNMYESLLFLSWGMGAFAILAWFFMRLRIVPLTASFMGALALYIADVVPGLDPFVRPAVPVLLDTIWMSIHVPIIMVSYSVLALAALFAHAQLFLLAFAPRGRGQQLSDTVDLLHYWYVHVGSILLLAGIITGSMWAASSWGRYWGWDPKEVWSLIAFLGYLAILHVRIDRERTPRATYVIGVVLTAAVLLLVVRTWQGELTAGRWLGLAGGLVALAFVVLVRGPFATAAKSIAAFWLIIMTYVGVNFVLGIGLHSYGFGTGAVARYMFLLGGSDLALMLLLGLIHIARSAPASLPAHR